jgi:ABC-type dipeptide/oligopeptide/nickel transport system permease component
VAGVGKWMIRRSTGRLSGVAGWIMMLGLVVMIVNLLVDVAYG